MLRRLLSLFLFTLALLAAPQAAQANVSLVDPLARELKQKGDREMVEGQYQEALKHFEAFRQQAPEHLLLLVPQLDKMIASTESHVTTVRFASNIQEAVVSVRGKVVIDAFNEVQRFDAGPAKVAIRANEKNRAPPRTERPFQVNLE